MCGRYALFGPHARYRDHFQTEAWPDFADRFNIAPSLSTPVIRQAPDGRRVAGLLRWGLVPHWAKDQTVGAKLNNARGESIAERPSFRSAYRRRRCIVPACGYYEWQAVPGQKWKQPWYIHLKDDEPMAMGGLWESWADPLCGEIVRTFCVITTGPNEVMAPIHDRMPVILRPDAWAAWLAPETSMEQIASLVAPAPAERLGAFQVSRKVSNAREDGPELIEQVSR
jgi:putative SOS response-associated peptidase YedK